MIASEIHRKILSDANVEREPYAVAGAAANLLAADRRDSFARDCYGKALSQLKLFAAAQRLLGAPLPSAGVGGTGGGLIPWSSRARRYAANLRALQMRSPHGSCLVEKAAQELPHFELHQAADGNFQVLDIWGEAPMWLGGLADHKAAKALWQFDPQKTPVPHPIAFDGLGFGWLFLHVLETTACSYLNYSCAMYILETDPLALAMLLHMHDLQTVIADPRNRWFIGESAEKVISDLQVGMVVNTGWTIPERFVKCALRERPALDLQSVITALCAVRDAGRKALLAKIQDYYAAKTVDTWRKRYEEALAATARPDQKLRILGITSRYTTVLQHSMHELQSAARSLGHHMEISMESDDQSLESPFFEKIAVLRPDLIVQISRMRYENPLLPKNVPFLTWDQDNLPCMRTPQAAASLTETGSGELTFVAGHGAIFGFGQLNWPERNCIFCHSAGATHRYHSGPVADNLLAQYACDISYVSNASAMPESLGAQLRERYSRDANYLQIFDEGLRQVYSGSLTAQCWDAQSLQALLASPPLVATLTGNHSALHEMVMDLHRYADRCYRHATLTWISRWCLANNKVLRLYGRGWEDNPQFKRWAAGIAQPGEQLRAIYQASRINLQLIESGFIHSRSLDGLAAGGFFLTRHTSADGDDPQALREIHELGRWSCKQGISSPAEIAAAGNPEMLARWQRALQFHPWSPEHAIRVLKIWARTPHPVVTFPMLPDISFIDEASFGTLASRFLEDQPLRQKIAAQMRQIVLEQFSYESRSNQFITHVAQSLSRAGA